METTTIEITMEQREQLNRLKSDTEAYREVIDRLLGSDKGELWTEQEIRDIVERTVEKQMHEMGRR